MSKAMQKCLKKTTGSRGFWPKEMRLPSSPNLNPLNCHIWMHVEKKACKIGHPILVSLKAAVEAYWANMFDMSLINSIKSFRDHLKKCITAEDSVFKK